MLQPLAEILAANVGVTVQQGIFLLTVLFSIPLAMLHRTIPSVKYRHLTSIVVGAYVLWVLFGLSSLNILVSSGIGYLLLYVLPLEKRRGPMIALAWILIYLSGGHIYQMIQFPYGWELDFTAPMMMLVAKYSSLAFTLFDARRPIEKLRSREKVYMTQDIPGVMEYFSFVYFYPTVVGGPTFEFRDYVDFTYDLGNWNPGTNNGYRLSNALLPAALKLGQVALIFVIYNAACTYAPLSYLQTAEFAALPTVFHRLFWVSMVVQGQRHKYYIAWWIAEVPCILSGLSYNGVDSTGKAKWTRVSVANYFSCEFAPSIKVAVDNWNIQIQSWLKNYVYVRMPVSKIVARVSTYMISAFWHGFYPGIYLDFIAAAFMTVAHTTLRRHVRPLFVHVEKDPPTARQPWPIMIMYHVMERVMTIFCGINFVMLPFLTLAVEPAWRVYRLCYFIPYIVILGLIALQFVLPSKPRSSTSVMKDKQHDN